MKDFTLFLRRLGGVCPPCWIIGCIGLAVAAAALYHTFG